ncbi:hypothetical protein QAD02_002912 [Eretmocerus hayati]|uniref:Uncharacterized protein n=1 Tax=Eretmocerus hayati TaxID=131215 RepID=A0ACC2NL80_9HYME|nr:hypothetical protein QAD02_002912 [Eretmocerus hayati]
MQAPSSACGTVSNANPHPQAQVPTAVHNIASFHPWESSRASPSMTPITWQQVLMTSAMPPGVQTSHAPTLALNTVPVASTNFRPYICAATVLTASGNSRLQAPAPNICQVKGLNSSRLVNLTCFPCVWFLMSSKTAHAYEACLKTLKEDIWPKMNPKEVIADFEEASEIAWGNIYPEAELTGCYFHFTQAIMRNAIRKGCATHRNPELQDNPERHLIIRMLMALALLPSGISIHGDHYFPLICEAFKAGTLVSEVDTRSPNYESIFLGLYDEEFPRRGVQRFCVFEGIDKTNNEQELMHRVYNFLFKHRQPLPWQFMDVFIEILKVDNFNLRVEKETMGTTKRRRKMCVIFNGADLLRCWYALKHKPKSFTPMMMVTKVPYSLKLKYIQLGQIHSITHGEKDEVDNDEVCEDVRDERVEALEAETGFLFDRDGEVESEKESNSNDNGGSVKGSVIDVVTDLRIDIKDIGDLFDSNLEDFLEENNQEQREIDAGPWRATANELHAEENESAEVRH